MIMEGGGEVHHFIMIYVTIIDIVRICQECSTKELTAADVAQYYSVIEHEICDLGYALPLCTKDIRNLPYPKATTSIHKGLKLLTIQVLHGVSSNKEISLSLYRTGKHFILMVK